MQIKREGFFNKYNSGVLKSVYNQWFMAEDRTAIKQLVTHCPLSVWTMATLFWDFPHIAPPPSPHRRPDLLLVYRHGCFTNLVWSGSLGVPQIAYPLPGGLGAIADDHKCYYYYNKIHIYMVQCHMPVGQLQYTQQYKLAWLKWNSNVTAVVA